MRVHKQPLLYFVLLGVVVFVVDTWLRRDAEVVSVGATVRAELDAELRRTLARAPTQPELDRALADWTTNELLFREASKLGLQENDSVIRLHLATKLKSLVKQRTIVAPPTEAELRASFDAHPERYTRPDTYDVTVVFVARGASPEAHAERVKEVLDKLAAGSEPKGAGDHFPRGPELKDVLLLQLEQVLKVDLSVALRPENQGRWQQVPNARGSYLLRLDHLNSGKPNFDALKGAIAAEIEVHKREAAFAQFVEELRTQYPITVEP
jgi:PPIC-type PPIASE domain